jgi:hypothetical protein
MYIIILIFYQMVISGRTERTTFANSFLTLPHLLGERGLWLAMPCAELIIFIALTADYQYRHKIRKVAE